MGSNVLITGAAGYIGGSVVADFLANNTLFEKHQISTVVRSEVQAKALSKLGINVLQLDLNDEKAVVESVLRYNINIVIQTASSINPTIALNLITALSKQKEVSGKKVYIIHTSGLSAFFEKTGWPAGLTRDTDPIFDIEKRLSDSFSIRKADVVVTEHAKAQGVTSFIVIPPLVYGKGTGEWNKLSVVLPVYVQAFISHKTAYGFPENTKVSAVHISDLAALYGGIIAKILHNEPLPNGIEGYYFALAHDIYMSDAIGHLARALKARGLIADPTPQLLTSDETAAEILGVPAPFVQPLWNSGDNIVIEKPQSIGWKPVWTQEQFYRNIDDEIQAVVELGKAKSSLIDSLHAAVKG